MPILNNVFIFPLIYLLKRSRNLSAFACRLTRLTGKSPYPIHPKHLINKPKIWYLRDIKKTDIVLDVGCGNGQHSIRIARKCNKITALDYNPEQLKIAKKSAKDKQIKNIEFKRFNLENKLPFINKSFHKVLALDVIEHLNNRGLFLKEIKRVLKLDGLLILTVPNKNTSWKKLQRIAGVNSFTDPDHKIEYSLKQIKNILKNYGFKVISIKPITYDTPFIGFLDTIGGLSLSLYKKLAKIRENKVKKNLNESIGFLIKAKF
jgi:ubiquinone/menaquinone biosynthesis C-methylase UbiE